MARNLITTSGGGGGGSYTHPDCICQTIICAGDYKYVDTTQSSDSNRYLSPWIILANCNKVESDTACCFDLQFDFSQYQEVKLDVRLPASTSVCCELQVRVGNSGGQDYCNCTYNTYYSTSNGSAIRCNYGDLGCIFGCYRSNYVMGIQVCFFRTSSGAYGISTAGDLKAASHIGYCYVGHNNCMSCGGVGAGGSGFVRPCGNTVTNSCMYWCDWTSLHFGRGCQTLSCNASSYGFGCFTLYAKPYESEEI